MSGYQSMWHTLCIRHGIIISRNQVPILMRELDPRVCEVRHRRRLRRREYTTPGPIFTWHVDGYDKLEGFSFPIHDCIDGFKNISDPKISANF